MTATTTAAPLRVIQVGLGGWGRDWAKTLKAVPEVVETVAWVEPWPEAMALLQKDVGVPASKCFSTLAEAVEAVDAEAVLVTTALPAHLPVVHEALSLGKHVLCEKPFAPSVDEARHAVDAAAAAGLTLAVSQNYRFFRGAAEAARIVRSGELGALSRVAVDFRKWANDFPKAGHVHYTIRHPLLLDMSIHHFDLMRWVTGLEPVTATAVAWNPPFSNFGEPSTGAATIQLEGGVVVDYRGSWTSTDTPTLWAGDWVMEFEQGAVHWTSRDDLRRRVGRAHRHPARRQGAHREAARARPHRPARFDGRVRAGDPRRRHPVDQRAGEPRHARPHVRRDRRRRVRRRASNFLRV